MYDSACRYKDLTKASLFFNTFYSISCFIVISLLTGLIWEVFTYMGKQFEKQDKIEEELEAIDFEKPDIKRVSRNSRRTTKRLKDNRSLNDSDEGPFAEDGDVITSKRRVRTLNDLEEPPMSPKTRRLALKSVPMDIKSQSNPFRQLLIDIYTCTYSSKYVSMSTLFLVSKD